MTFGKKEGKEKREEGIGGKEICHARSSIMTNFGLSRKFGWSGSMVDPIQSQLPNVESRVSVSSKKHGVFFAFRAFMILAHQTPIDSILFCFVLNF